MNRSPEDLIDLLEAQRLWEPADPYLNTASYGLPPTPAFEALQAALADWRHGATSWEPWAEATEGARAVFVRLVGVATEQIAVSATVSELIGLVARRAGCWYPTSSSPRCCSRSSPTPTAGWR